MLVKVQPLSIITRGVAFHLCVCCLITPLHVVITDVRDRNQRLAALHKQLDEQLVGGMAVHCTLHLHNPQARSHTHTRVVQASAHQEVEQAREEQAATKEALAVANATAAATKRTTKELTAKLRSTTQVQ